MESGIDEGVLALPWAHVLRRLAGEPLRARTEPCRTLSVGLSIFDAPMIPTAVYVAYLSLSLQIWHGYLVGPGFSYISLEMDRRRKAK